MITYWLRLYPQQPLSLADPRFIPGRAIRGALIAVLRGECIPNAAHEHGPCNARCQYWPTFGSNAPGSSIRVSDAHATLQDAISPFSLSARTCPVAPGFITENGHGIVDIAIRVWTFEQIAADPLRRGALLAPYELRCAVCGVPLIACSGQVVQRAEHDWRTVAVSVKSITTTHRPAQTYDQPIFSQSGTLLGGNAYYAARLDVPDGLDSLLRAALANGLMVGARRTRGQGLVRAELIPRPDPGLTTHARIAAFNRTLRNEQRFYSAMNVSAAADDDGAWYFTLDVTAMHPAYTRQPDPLAEIKALRAVTVVRRWLKAHDGEGRSTATGLRSGNRLSLSGVFICRAAPDADRAMLEQTLAYLETHGVGIGSERGYGSITVCDPFHLELEPI
jgi:hypothetical protein